MQLTENLERLDKGPEKSSNAFTATKQLDKPHDSEQTEEVDADYCWAARLQQTALLQQQYNTGMHTVVATVVLGIDNENNDGNNNDNDNKKRGRLR